MRPPARSSNGPRSTSRALAARMTTSWPISVLPQKGFANDLWSTSTRMTRPHERLSHAAAKQACPRSRYAPCDLGRSIEITPRTWCPRAERRCGAPARSTEHSRVLSPFRIEGPAGVDGLSRDGDHRKAKVKKEDDSSRYPSRRCCRLDRRTTRPRIQREHQI